jgi:hypothetical protein
MVYRALQSVGGQPRYNPEDNTLHSENLESYKIKYVACMNKIGNVLNFEELGEDGRLIPKY